MKASIPTTTMLLGASCCVALLVATAPAAAQLRFPSLSSALSSLTGFGSSGSASGQQSIGGVSGAAAPSASPYSGLVRDYGRNLMMAMSNIYPTLFKPPQQQQQQLQSAQGAQQSPFEQALSAASQFSSQGLFSGQSPSFSLGGSTFSITPSLPFGSLTGGAGSSVAQGPSGPAGVAASQQQPQLANSPFSSSFGSSINSPSSFGPLSSSPFFSQGPSFAPASSYNAAFEAANGGPIGSFGMSAPSHHSSVVGSSAGSLLPQASQPQPLSSYSSLPSFGPSQHDSSSASLLGAHSQGVPSISQYQPSASGVSASIGSGVHAHHSHGQQQPQHSAIGQQASGAMHGQQSAGSQFGAPQQHAGVHAGQPFASASNNQAYHVSQSYVRPDVMSMAASMQVPSVSNSYRKLSASLGSRR